MRLAEHPNFACEDMSRKCKVRYNWWKKLHFCWFSISLDKQAFSKYILWNPVNLHFTGFWKAIYFKHQENIQLKVTTALKISSKTVVTSMTKFPSPLEISKLRISSCKDSLGTYTLAHQCDWELEVSKLTGLGSRLIMQTAKYNASLRALIFACQIILQTRMTERDQPANNESLQWSLSNCQLGHQHFLVHVFL